ncbi:sulfatase-like hydrolase/transferase [Kriegella sp. EG-1]|nr:sulfatase-like hydrolase/transferase [Flavobacteriaceae bacterium EG-1]
MKKLSIILILIILISSCNEKTTSELKLVSKKPNIVLIMSDDQGWGDLSISGNSNLKTPNIDALKTNGASFENFYVQPVCSPTRAELLTGRYATRSGVYSTSEGGERMNTDETTIAEILKQAGYNTAAYGKWHNGMQPPYHPNARGFDDYYGFTSGHWGNYFSPMLEHNGKIVKGKGFLVDDLTDHGLNFIDKNKTTPFFLYLPYNTPHGPMQVPDEYWNNFKDKDLKMKYHGDEKEDINYSKAALAMVENIDYNVGRLTKKLKELKLEENTIIIYLSDNGPNGYRWNGGMKGKKGSTDEGGVRTPFFIQWRDSIIPGTKINTIAGAIDILPTIAKLTGAKLTTNKPLDGIDLSPLIFNCNKKTEDRVIINHWSTKTSVRTQRYRLDHENRLFDMVNDHGQTTDISLSNQQLTDSLIKIKFNWLSETLKFSNESDNRAITLGHPDFEYTQIPARDGIPHGNIKRSNRWPNCSFFTNWKSKKDFITWDVEVLADGIFEVELYYTMKSETPSFEIELSHGEQSLSSKITESHDPPLIGMENDRVNRTQSYVKDFKPQVLGNINLKKGRNLLTLKANEIKGENGIDVRLLMFKRVD